jgi:hypothetical protein
MKAVLLAPLLLLAPACAMNVYHDSKTEAEMKAEVRLCSSQAKRDHPWNPQAALHAAEKCLAEKGYTKEAPPAPPKASAAASSGPAAEAGTPRHSTDSAAAPAGNVPAPGEPCAVPCRRPK